MVSYMGNPSKIRLEHRICPFTNSGVIVTPGRKRRREKGFGLSFT